MKHLGKSNKRSVRFIHWKLKKHCWKKSKINGKTSNVPGSEDLKRLGWQ